MYYPHRSPVPRADGPHPAMHPSNSNPECLESGMLRQRDAHRPGRVRCRGRTATAAVSGRGRMTTRLGRLVIWKCRDCAVLLPPLTVSCHSCGNGELEPVDSAGAGVIVSCRTADRSPDPVCGAPCPSVIAIVELDEGPWVYSWIDGEVPVPSDRPVRVHFRCTQPGERFPVFEPRDSR